jgi:hypothetical protein
MLYTKRLLAKMKQKGTAAFDSSDSDEDGRYGEQVARKPVASSQKEQKCCQAEETDCKKQRK